MSVGCFLLTTCVLVCVCCPGIIGTCMPCCMSMACCAKCRKDKNLKRDHNSVHSQESINFSDSEFIREN